MKKIQKYEALQISPENFFLDNKESADLVTFTEEILKGNLHFLCSVIFVKLDFK